MLVMMVVMMMVMRMWMLMLMQLLPLKLLPHVVSILPIRIILSLHIMNLVPQCLRVQVKRRTVALPNMQRDILSTKHLFHGVLGGGHELGGEPEFAVGTEDGEGGDVAVALVSLFLHLSEDVTDDAAVVVLGDVEKLRPGEDVIEVVLHLVILR